MAAENITLEVSWDILDACNGFSMDMGGTNLKLVYIDKDEWLEPEKRKQNSKGKIHLTSFTHAQFHEGTVYTFIKEHVLLKPGQDNKPPVICSTGFWASTNREPIDKELGIRTESLLETDCFVKALTYTLHHLPKEQISEKLPDDDISATKILMGTAQGAFDQLDDISKMMKLNKVVDDIDIDDHFEDPYDPGSDSFMSDPDIFPCIIVLSGSGFGSMIIHKDGSYEISNMSRRAGKTWLGMGSLLSAAENYQSIMELSAKGSIADLDFVYTDILQPQENTSDKLDGDNAYQKTRDMVQAFSKVEPISIFSFGKTADKTIDDFKTEDLVRTFLHAIITDMTSQVSYAAAHHKVKHIFFSGGFVGHPIVKREIYVEMMRKGIGLRYLRPNMPAIQCHFLKGGQYYGAIGALLNHKLNFGTSKSAT